MVYLLSPSSFLLPLLDPATPAPLFPGFEDSAGFLEGSLVSGGFSGFLDVVVQLLLEARDRSLSRRSPLPLPEDLGLEVVALGWWWWWWCGCCCWWWWCWLGETAAAAAAAAAVTLK